MTTFANLPPTIYSGPLELSWRAFLAAGDGLDNEDTRTAFVAGWVAMYANLIERVH